MYTQLPFSRVLIVIIFVLTISSAAPLAAQSDTPSCSDEILSSFDYADDLPFDVEEIGVEEEDGITIHDVTFSLDEERRVEAYRVVPPGDGPFAGVLFVHWLGHTASDRTEFLPDAIELAKKGTVSLLINAMWSEPGWFSRRKLEDDYTLSIRQVIDLRRALDLLLSQPKVDPDRIGYAGHDFGAMFGAILAGVDGRPQTYVFMAGTDDFNNGISRTVLAFQKGMKSRSQHSPQPVSLVRQLRCCSSLPKMIVMYHKKTLNDFLMRQTNPKK